MNLYTFVKLEEEETSGKKGLDKFLDFAQVVAQDLPTARQEIDFCPDAFTVIPIPELVAKTLAKGHQSYRITDNEDLQEF